MMMWGYMERMSGFLRNAKEVIVTNTVDTVDELANRGKKFEAVCGLSCFFFIIFFIC